MNGKELLRFRWTYWEKILDRRTWVMYLQPLPIDVREVGEFLTNVRNPLLNALHEHAQAYMTEGKEPPAAIAGPVMNFVDDVASGRTPVIRTGDYMALHKFMQQHKT